MRLIVAEIEVQNMSYSYIHKAIKAIIMDYADDLYGHVGDPDPDMAADRIMAMLPQAGPGDEIRKIESGEGGLASIREAVRVEVATCKEGFIDCDEAKDRIMAIFLQPETAETAFDVR